MAMKELFQDKAKWKTNHLIESMHLVLIVQTFMINPNLTGHMNKSVILLLGIW
jgi:hypothetical protein